MLLNRIASILLVVLTVAMMPLFARAQTTAPPLAATAPPAGFASGITLGDPLPGPIRKGDLVRVIVAGVDALSGDFRVDVDGSIQIPRVGQLTLATLMPVEASRVIARQIVRRKLVRTPSVSVYIIARKAREVLVNGAVTTQGRLIIKDNALLSEALESAIPAPAADLSRVTITRADGQEIKVDYKQFRNGISNASQFNPTLEDGDRIYVFSSNPSEGTIRLTGEVKDPTRPLIPIQQGATVSQVLQTAGGVTDFADRDNIVLIRGSERIPVKYNDILKAKPGSDIVLQDRDELIVPRLDRRKQYAVAGAVKDAHTFPLLAPTTLLDALGEAGGPLDGAQQNKVEIRRKNASGQVVSSVKDLKKDRDATTAIQDGDYIFVPFGKRRQPLDILSVAGLVSALAVTIGQLRR